MGSKDSTQPKLPRATLEQKIKILDYYEKSQRPQLDTVEKFKDEVAISTLSFNEWVKHQDEYRQRYQQLVTSFQKNAKRKVRYKYDQINRAMDLLVQQKLERGEAITEPILRGYWQVYAHQFKVEDPKRLIGFSHGWLSQFKKRHGLSRKKDQGKQESLLRNPASLLAAVESAELLLAEQRHSPEKPQEQPAQAQFQPQHTLSFPNQYPYYNEEPVQKSHPHSQLQQMIDGDSRQSLVLAMSMPMVNEKQPSAAEIERFIFSIADHFFHEHQYLYPQTVKTYQEFKSSFLSERLIDLRSAKENQLKPHMGLGNQAISGEQPLQNQLQLQTRIQNQVHNQIQDQLQQMPSAHRSLRLRLKQQKNPYKHKSGLGHASQSIGHHSQSHGQGQSQSQSLGHGQSQGQTHQSHGINGTAEKHRYVDNSLQPLSLSQLLPLHRLHPLARTTELPISQNMSQLREMHQGMSQSPPPSGSFTGESRDGGLDEMFSREQAARYGKGQWPAKSSLRKIWEQNKIMLS